MRTFHAGDRWEPAGQDACSVSRPFRPGDERAGSMAQRAAGRQSIAVAGQRVAAFHPGKHLRTSCAAGNHAAATTRADVIPGTSKSYVTKTYHRDAADFFDLFDSLQPACCLCDSPARRRTVSPPKKLGPDYLTKTPSRGMGKISAIHSPDARCAFRSPAILARFGRKMPRRIRSGTPCLAPCGVSRGGHKP